MNRERQASPVAGACLEALFQPGELAAEQAHGLLIAATGVLILGLAKAQHPGGAVCMHPHIHIAGVQLRLVSMQHRLGTVAHATDVLNDTPHIGHPLHHLGVGPAKAYFGVSLHSSQPV